MSIILFPVITPDVCRRYVREGRRQQNTLAAQIRAAINVRAGETPAEQGSGDIPEGELRIEHKRTPRWPDPHNTHIRGGGQTATGQFKGFCSRADNCPPRAGYSPAAGRLAGAGRPGDHRSQGQGAHAHAGGGLLTGGVECR